MKWPSFCLSIPDRYGLRGFYGRYCNYNDFSNSSLGKVSYADNYPVEILDSVATLSTSVNGHLEPQQSSCGSGEGESESESESCELADTYGLKHLENGDLSALWGHEFVGVDLAKDFLKDKALSKTKIATSESVNLSQIPQQVLGPNLRASLENNLMSRGGTHGTKVNNIIFGNDAMGVASFSELSATEIFSSTENEFKLSSEEFLKNGIKIFQASQFIDSNQVDYLKKVITDGVATIRSAGNSYPEFGVEQASPEISIIVGQLSPMGVPSLSSSAGSSVTILAPGRNYSTSNGEFEVFGGTSGAQPIVAGCIANVMSILPDLNQDEVKSLLIATSIPTVNSRDAIKRNGSGTINCYKLVRVAHNLSENWPESRQFLSSTEILNFTDEVQALINKVDQLENRSGSCAKREALDSLRQAFLLDPYNESVIRRIASIYEGEGFTLNSQLYKSMLGIDLNEAISLNANYKSSRLFSGDILRYAVEHLGAPREIIKNSLMSENSKTVIYASIHASGKVEPSKIEERLIQVVLDGAIDGYNFSLFEKAYFEANSLSSDKLFNACSRMTSQWEQEEYNSSLTSCLIFVKHDVKSGKEYLKRELLRDSDLFLSFFKSFFQPSREFAQAELEIIGSLSTDLDIPLSLRDDLQSILRM